MLPSRITSKVRRANERTHKVPRDSDFSLAVGCGLSSWDFEREPESNLPKLNCVVVLFIWLVLVVASKMNPCFQ